VRAEEPGSLGHRARVDVEFDRVHGRAHASAERFRVVARVAGNGVAGKRRLSAGPAGVVDVDARDARAGILDVDAERV
jgi:hypothetical protein